MYFNSHMLNYCLPTLVHVMLIHADKATKRMLKQKSAHTITLLAPPLRVLVQVESSGKWPQGEFLLFECEVRAICRAFPG